MGKFLFQARAANGQVQTGQLEAASESEVRMRLKQQNLTPLKIVTTSATKTGKKSSGGFFDKKVASKELQISTRQFAVLINSGIPVVDGLKMLSEGKRDKMLLEATKKVKLSIESGRTLADSLAAHPNVFDRFFVNMVRAGEQAGILDNIFQRLAIYMEKSEKLKKQIVGAMAYPAIVMVLAGGVVAAILLFVMPKMKTMYGTAELPALTQAVLDVSEFLQAKWYIFVGAMVVLPYVFLQWYKTPAGRSACDRFFIRAPLFGDLIQKSSIARMTRTLATLLSSGVSVIEALEIASRTSGNKVIEDTLIRCKESVTQGKPLASPLAREKMIPDMVTQMISIGEQTGNVDTMLNKIADFYEDDVENSVKSLTSMIEPIMMVGLGSIIATLVVAMYLPVFNLASVMGK